MNNKRQLQLKVWSDMGEFAVQIAGLSSHRDVRSSGWSWIEQQLPRVLDVKEWGKFEVVLRSIAEVLLIPSGHRDAGWLPDSRLETIEKNGEQWTPRQEGAGWFLEVQVDVTAFVEAKKVTVGAPNKGIEIMLSFEYPKEGSKAFTSFQERLHPSQGHEVLIKPVTWEDKLYIKADDSRNWVFNQRSKDLLGERLERRGGYGEIPLYIISPLAGERFIWYKGPATDKLGIELSNRAPRDSKKGNIFASIGGLDLCLQDVGRYDHITATSRL